ncbi:MAG: permease [Actinomycetia bacterium]|nr:permease [Actinomycetes bacterium]
MTVTDSAILGVAGALLVVSGFLNRQKTVKAVKIGRKQFGNTLVFFVAIFAAIGLLEALVTPAQIQAVLGSGRGIFAPLVAALIGGLAAGPPAAVYPLGKYLLAQHASTAAVGTLLIAWVAVGTISLPAEVRFFGARFAFTRWGATLVLSIVAGIVMGWLL